MRLLLSIFSTLCLMLGLITTGYAVTAETKIIHGTSAKPAQAAWQVALFKSNAKDEVDYICSGTLIDAQWVLTAAHCVASDQHAGDRYYVVAGVTDLDRLDNAQIIEVSQTVVQPDYQAALNLDNDIALLKLERPVNVQQCAANCRVIPWLGSAQINLAALNTTAQIAGWGRVQSERDDQVSDPFSSMLQIAPFKIVSCGFGSYQFDGKTWPLSRNMFCATGAAATQPADTCEGDSGAGLIVNSATGQPLVAGITSWGEKTNCGERTLPSVYTRVSNYDDWILSYINPVAYAERLKAKEQEQQAAQQQNSSNHSSGGGSASWGVLLGLMLLAGLRLKLNKV